MQFWTNFGDFFQNVTPWTTKNISNQLLISNDDEIHLTESFAGFLVCLY